MSETKEQKLLPCPFCGTKHKDNNLMLWNLSDHDGDIVTSKVMCQRCGAHGGYESGQGYAEAIAAWNRRALSENNGIHNELYVAWKLGFERMKERPIIFSADSIRAILEGRKTQTRRVIKPQPVLKNRIWEWHTGGWSNGCNPVFLPGHGMYNRMPYKPGDRLWVRETYLVSQLRTVPSLGKRVFYKADGHFSYDNMKQTSVPLDESRNPSYCIQACGIRNT